MSKIYLGSGPSRREVFRSSVTPDEATYGHIYRAVIGPFHTIRGAKAMLWYGTNNPNMLNVRDAERIGLQYADDLMDKATVQWFN